MCEKPSDRFMNICRIKNDELIKTNILKLGEGAKVVHVKPTLSAMFWLDCNWSLIEKKDQELLGEKFKDRESALKFLFNLLAGEFIVDKVHDDGLVNLKHVESGKIVDDVYQTELKAV